MIRPPIISLIITIRRIRFGIPIVLSPIFVNVPTGIVLFFVVVPLTAEGDLLLLGVVVRGHPELLPCHFKGCLKWRLLILGPLELLLWFVELQLARRLEMLRARWVEGLAELGLFEGLGGFDGRNEFFDGRRG